MSGKRHTPALDSVPAKSIRLNADQDNDLDDADVLKNLPVPTLPVPTIAAETTFTPVLGQQYRDRIRPILNSIDKLRSHGLQNELRLPTVAVVGDQSVGKSSVLEAISGVELPRGSGIVTRCPLQLSMRSKPSGDWTGNISYKNSQGAQIDSTIADKTQVGSLVRKAQNEITGSLTGVLNQQIDLTIESSDAPDLTLVDLPGIARYSENDPHISEATKQLILSCINQEQVIILVVVPCSVDIETVEAIALAKKVDPHGQRTIGVLTCPDMTNPGNEEDIRAIVSNNGRVRLRKGFVMVKCRSPLELRSDISLSDMSKLEADFFNSDARFNQLPKDLVGTRTLAEKLTDELFKAVASGIGTLETSLKAKLKEYEAELKDLGDSQCDTDSDKRFYLIRKLHQFLSKVHAVTVCSEDDSEAYATGSSSSLYIKCLNSCSRFGRNSRGSIPEWTKGYSEQIPDSVSAEILNRRGRELRTFTFVFPILEKIVRKDYLPEVQELTFELLEAVQSDVVKSLIEISNDCFKAFPRLQEAVKDTVVKAVEAKETECCGDLETLISHEHRVYTQDSLFSERLEVVTSVWEACIEQRKQLKPSNIGPFGFQATAVSTAARQQQKSSQSSSHSQLPASVPEQTPEPSTVEQIRLGARAYLDLASQRIADTVPMSVLSHMLDGVAKKISGEMTKLFSGSGEQGQAELLALLSESRERQRRRRHLEQAVKQMRASEMDLMQARQSGRLLED